MEPFYFTAAAIFAVALLVRMAIISDTLAEKNDALAEINDALAKINESVTFNNTDANLQDVVSRMGTTNRILQQFILYFDEIANAKTPNPDRTPSARD